MALGSFGSSEVTRPSPDSAGMCRAASVVDRNHFESAARQCQRMSRSGCCADAVCLQDFSLGKCASLRALAICAFDFIKRHLWSLTEATYYSRCNLSSVTPCPQASFANFTIRAVAFCFAKLPREIRGSCLLLTPRHTCGLATP